MGRAQKFLSSILLLQYLIIPFISSANSSCPIDFSYVETFPWDKSTCHPATDKSCCQTMRGLLGIGLAKYLKNTSMFYLPNTEIASSCLSNIRAKLASMSIFPPPCNNTSPEELAVNASGCAGIVSIKDWIQKVGATSQLDTACNEDLLPLTRCISCRDAGLTVSSMLQSLQPNSTKCFYYTILYASGVVNEYGPEDIRGAACTLGLPLVRTATDSRFWSRKRVLAVVLGSLGLIIVILALWVSIIIFQKKKIEREQTALREEYVRGVKAKVLPNTGAKWFQVDELEKATNGFSQKNLIGQGGYGIVYKGTLLDGTVVAVKQLLDLDLNGDDQEFTNEAEIISKIRHRNLLALRGFCVTSDAVQGNRRYLVYDFMSNGSLDEHLFNQVNPSGRQPLSWPLRKIIIIDVAKGLSYLHNGIKPAIYHRDIKTTNILLDADMKAKVADFGLAKQTSEGESNVQTRIAGTYGYLAPEYALYGQLTEKSDVYSFGIIILEIMSGRKVLDSSDSSTILITDWAWELVRSGRVEEVFDEKMREDGSKAVMERFVHVGILCAHVMVALRPNISDALKMLEGDIDIPTLPDRPMPLSHVSYQTNSVMFSASVGASSGRSSARTSISRTSISRTSISSTM